MTLPKGENSSGIEVLEPRRRSRKRRRPARDRFSNVLAHAAYRTLKDADASVRELKSSDPADAQNYRLRWVTCITLLRTVGHVLKKVDAPRSRWIGEAILRTWKRWQDDASGNLIWHEFIEKERNTLLKEYQFVYQQGSSSASPPEEPLPLLIGDAVYQPEAAAQAAIRWWKVQLGAIEDDAKNLRQEARASEKSRAKGTAPKT